jgi:hypothetical protein
MQDEDNIKATKTYNDDQIKKMVRDLGILKKAIIQVLS